MRHSRASFWFKAIALVQPSSSISPSLVRHDVFHQESINATRERGGGGGGEGGGGGRRGRGGKTRKWTCFILRFFLHLVPIPFFFPLSFFSLSISPLVDLNKPAELETPASWKAAQCLSNATSYASNAKYVPKQASIFIFGRMRIVRERVFMPNVETGRNGTENATATLFFPDKIWDYHRPRFGFTSRRKKRLKRDDKVSASVWLLHL